MKALVFTKKGDTRLPIGIMTKKPSAAQIKSGVIELESGDEGDFTEFKVRIKYGRVKEEILDADDNLVATFVCDAIATHPDDVDVWHLVPGFKSFGEFLGTELQPEEFI